jgi:hypothetical protein
MKGEGGGFGGGFGAFFLSFFFVRLSVPFLLFICARGVCRAGTGGRAPHACAPPSFPRAPPFLARAPGEAGALIRTASVTPLCFDLLFFPSFDLGFPRREMSERGMCVRVRAPPCTAPPAHFPLSLPSPLVPLSPSTYKKTRSASFPLDHFFPPRRPVCHPFLFGGGHAPEQAATRVSAFGARCVCMKKRLKKNKSRLPHAPVFLCQRLLLLSSSRQPAPATPDPHTPTQGARRLCLLPAAAGDF